MSDPQGILVFAATVAWLMMGGASLWWVASDPPKGGWGDAAVGVFFLCVILGPFMFGAMLFALSPLNKKPIKDTKGE